MGNTAAKLQTTIRTEARGAVEGDVWLCEWGYKSVKNMEKDIVREDTRRLVRTSVIQDVERRSLHYLSFANGKEHGIKSFWWLGDLGQLALLAWP